MVSYKPKKVSDPFSLSGNVPLLTSEQKIKRLLQSARWDGLKQRFLHNLKLLIEPGGKNRIIISPRQSRQKQLWLTSRKKQNSNIAL